MGLGYSKLSVEVHGGKPHVAFSADAHIAVALEEQTLPLRVTITGIRKGYRGRFIEMTKEQAEQNTKFWQSAINQG